MGHDEKLDRSRLALGAMFLGALGLQMTKQDFFAGLVPSYLAKYKDQVAVATRAMLATTGISFVLAAFGAPVRLLARCSALGVLLPSLPEAFNQVRQPDRLREAGIAPQVAAARIPVQGLVIVWVWRSTRSR